jgi:hypothetical protein
LTLDLNDDVSYVQAQVKRVQVIIDREERTNIQEGVKLLANTGILKGFGGEVGTSPWSEIEGHLANFLNLK